MDKKREEDVDYAAAYRQFMNLRVKRARLFHLPNNQAKTYQTTKRKLAKQPNKNLPNNQIVIKFFVCFREKLYFCTKILLYGRAF